VCLHIPPPTAPPFLAFRLIFTALDDLLDAEALEFDALASETQAMIAMLSPTDPHRKDAAAALLRMLEDADPHARNLRWDRARAVPASLWFVDHPLATVCAPASPIAYSHGRLWPPFCFSFFVRARRFFFFFSSLAGLPRAAPPRC
jgi:hypothetical protein